MDVALALSRPTGFLSAPRETLTVTRRPSPLSVPAPPPLNNGLSAGSCSRATNPRRLPSPARMGLRAVESFDGSFQLKPECERDLKALLGSETFCKQVSEQPGLQPGAVYDFTGELFQPVPWSANTKHGMPQEFEKYLEDKNFAIINVPPNFMFKAKVFHPSRLCAVFRKRVTLHVDNARSEDSQEAEALVPATLERPSA